MNHKNSFRLSSIYLFTTIYTTMEQSPCLNVVPNEREDSPSHSNLQWAPNCHAPPRGTHMGLSSCPRAHSTSHSTDIKVPEAPMGATNTPWLGQPKHQGALLSLQLLHLSLSQHLHNLIRIISVNHNEEFNYLQHNTPCRVKSRWVSFFVVTIIGQLIN